MKKTMIILIGGPADGKFFPSPPGTQPGFLGTAAWGGPGGDEWEIYHGSFRENDNNYYIHHSQITHPAP